MEKQAPFPRTLIKGGMRLTVANQKGFDAAVANGFTFYALSDEGHIRLVGYLETLLICAKNGDFHDFASATSMPKHNLRNQLLNLAEKTLDGFFDN